MKKKKKKGQFYNTSTNELNDRAILDALSEARAMYDDGAIIETADLLRRIIDAIESFDPDREVN